jgi:hypothetical protein
MRLLWYAGSLLVGAAVAACSVAVYRDVVAGVPFGLVLAVLTTFATAWLLRRPPAPARATSAYALGWLVLFGGVVAGRPEGDFAIAADLLGYLRMGAALVLVVVGLASVTARQHGKGPGEP